jgi:hypothetical protein
MTESGIRRNLRKQGFIIKQSRRALSSDNQGEFMVLDAERNYIVAGERYDMSLDDLEKWTER